VKHWRQQYRVFTQLMTLARREAGVTQMELSRILGKPQSFVSKYESGERRLDVVEFISICKALGVPPTKLIKRLEARALSTVES